MYFLTGIEKCEPKANQIIDIGAYQTFGYFSDYKDAEDAVLGYGITYIIPDIQEGIYNYIIIEYIPEGLYYHAESREFYKWNNEKRKFYKLSDSIKEEKEIISLLNDDYGNWAFFYPQRNLLYTSYSQKSY